MGLDSLTPMPDVTRVLFLCTHNSARSQMAEAFLNELGEGRFEAFSAGTEARGLHPLSVQAMAEAGIDISQHTSKHLSEFLNQQVDTVITVCGNADEACPIFPGQVNRHHWPFPDPAHAPGTDEEKLEIFRQARDDIRRLFEAYAAGRLDGSPRLKK